MIFRRFFASLLLLISSYSFADDSMMFNDIAFPNLDGREVNMTEHRGKVVLLNFWATWCPPCVKEMPSMELLRQKYADQDFEVVAINAGEDTETVEAFLLQMDEELTFPILLDKSGASFSTLGIRGLPMSFLLNKEGRSVMTFLGGREWMDSTQVKLIEKELAR
jgi:thiol-disulfide isomerase/thioredoxin